MRPATPITDSSQPRAGFSLIELLVVMTIMAILASLAFVVLGASGNAAREASTKSAIRILSGALRERADAFREATAGVVYVDYDVPIKLKNRIFRATVQEFLYAYRTGGNTYTITPVQGEVFVRKAMFKALFPQREEDLYGYNGVLDSGGLDDSPLLARMYQGGSLISTSWKGRNGSGNPQADSAELLYLSLTEGDVLGLPAAEIGGIDNSMIGDTDGDGNLEFLDGWGRPLQFYNWPTQLIKDNGAAYTGTVTVPPMPPTFPTTEVYPTASLLISNLPVVSSTAPASSTVNRNRVDRDPEDITRALTTPTLQQPSNTYQTPLRFDFSLNHGGVPNAKGFNSIWYHDANTVAAPLIVSAGPDGILGLHLPTETGSDRLARVLHTHEACQALGDNITNQQRGPQ